MRWWMLCVSPCVVCLWMRKYKRFRSFLCLVSWYKPNGNALDSKAKETKVDVRRLGAGRKERRNGGREERSEGRKRMRKRKGRKIRKERGRKGRRKGLHGIITVCFVVFVWLFIALLCIAYSFVDCFLDMFVLFLYMFMV